MKNKNYVLLLPFLLLMSACSTTQHSEKKVIEAAALEAPVKDSDETQSKILEILSQDSSVQDGERKSLVAIIDKSFAEYKELELLTNQKKTLLIREYMNKNPDMNKIHSIQASIKKNYSKKSDLMMNCFDRISKVMKMHPCFTAKWNRIIKLIH